MLQFTVNENMTFELSGKDGQLYLDNIPVKPDIKELPSGLISVLHNNKSYTACIEQVDNTNKQITLRVNGQSYTIGIKEPIDQLLSSMGMDMQSLHKAEPVKAPMPGLVLKILVEEGQQINKGDGLIVLEAMKMENILKAAANATVKAIKVSPRTAVEKGAVLIELE